VYSIVESGSNDGLVNLNTETYVSWTFREQPKFFDVVTYTGTGANRTVAHNLGSVPGCIFVKRTDTTGAWQVYHRSLANTQYMVLNTTATVATGATRWNSTTPTDTVFSVGTDATVNASGGTYVAYIFAHNAGGFGLSGTDNVISCGSSDGSPVNLGWEPQWLLYRSVDFTDDWHMIDNIRGASTSVNPSANTWRELDANTSSAETSNTGSSGNPNILFSATGFTLDAIAGTAIYIAIRRGPMKVPTTGTSVFSPIAVNVAAGTAQTTGFVVDSQWKALRTSSDTLNSAVDDRLRGINTVTNTASGRYVITSATSAEATTNATTFGWNNTGFLAASYYSNKSSVFWNFGRAPGFMDIVCYTGTGANVARTHNLGVAPEFWLVKRRDASAGWEAGSTAIANTEYLVLNTTAAKATGATRWNSTYPTTTQFTTGTATTVNASAGTYIAYFFATCPGVSKVGSYTGNGSSQTINCGFTAGSRFVLIKRTDSTGDWYVWDSARGIVSGNDPHISLNTTAAEVTTNDTIDTDSTGFVVNQVAATNVNVTSATYIFLAIA